MLNTYLKIARHLLDAMPDVRWIDRDKGQIDHEEDYHSLMTPAILLDFNEVLWKPLTRGTYSGEGAIIVKLIFPKPADTFTREASPLQEYEGFNTSAVELHQAISQLKEVKERRKGVDYFTKNWYVIEQFYDLDLLYEVPIKTEPKPTPKVLSTTLNIPQ
jgi:hypothetical protein